MRAAAEAIRALPELRFWNRSFMALVVAPQFPMAEWFAALDRQLDQAPSFFRERPIVVDLAGAVSEGPDAAGIVLDGLESRGLRLVGVDGIELSLLAKTPWSHLARAPTGRDIVAESKPPSAGGLLIDQPVRSGQSVVFEGGDITIVGSVASGAEVIAGGSIHIYGALRGRAIAGLRAGERARIFCRRLEAELVGVDRLYRSADHWGATLHGRAAQVLCDRGALRLVPLD